MAFEEKRRLHFAKDFCHHKRSVAFNEKTLHTCAECCQNSTTVESDWGKIWSRNFFFGNLAFGPIFLQTQKEVAIIYTNIVKKSGLSDDLKLLFLNKTLDSTWYSIQVTQTLVFFQGHCHSFFFYCCKFGLAKNLLVLSDAKQLLVIIL